MSCRSCLTKNQKDYCSLLSVFPEFGKKSILDLLNFVTASEISFSQSLPCEICLNCFKNLKIAYNFIVLFKISQAVLQKNAQKYTAPDSNVDSPEGQSSVIFKKEMDLGQILDSDDDERIVIVNDDGSTYVDMVHEIFGGEETEDKIENIQRQTKKNEDIKSSNIDKSRRKIILVPADDVLKPKKSLKLGDGDLFKKNQGNVNISYPVQDEVFFNEEDEVFFKEEDEVFFKEESEVNFSEEDNKIDETNRDTNVEDNVLYQDQDDEIHSIKDGNEDQLANECLFNTKKIETIRSSSKDKTRKIILVAPDDVLKQKPSSNPRDGDFFGKSPEVILGNASHYEQEESFSNEEEEIPYNEEDGAVFKEENEVYFTEDKVDQTSEDTEDDNNSYQVQEDEMHSNEDSEEDQDFKQEILEIGKNLEGKMNNIQIVTIDDVLRSSKRNKEVEKRVLSVDDVLQVKSRTKKNIPDDCMVTFSCDICNKTFDRRRKLTLHKLRNHNPNWKEKFKCHICGLQSKTMSAYRHHLAKHENIRYACNLCEKNYMSKSKLRDHILRVHEKKLDNKYLCTTCGKGFKFSNALEYHMNKHTNSKNFICRYCGFASLALGALKRHERVHTGERPYECKHCKKTFAGAAEKQKHEFGHEGVFRYNCKYCNKKFIQTYNMKVHWMQHKGSYVCEICQRNFADAEILKFHYAHSHRIKDVVIEDVELKSGEELVEDADVIVE